MWSITTEPYTKLRCKARWRQNLVEHVFAQSHPKRRLSVSLLWGLLLVGLLLILPDPVQAVGPIPPIQLKKLASGFDKPVFLTHAGDGSGRLFVVEQRGTIRVLEKGERGRGKVFLDIREKVKSGGEMGLLSIAFHPGYKTNGRFYVYYTVKKRGLWSVLSSFSTDPSFRFNEKQLASRKYVDLKTEKEILRFRQPYSNHNGGQIAFGPDGYLYIGTGDGGAGHDPYNYGQRVDTLLGKMLRIDVDQYSKKSAYLIPPDNPFRKTTGSRQEIYAYGLRNPWRFSFDRQSGILIAGDVGQWDREEIDLIEKGKNYGWRRMEGLICTPKFGAKCDQKGLTPPLLDYKRSDGISVTGGYVYRGKKYPQWDGVYFFGDYGSGHLWGIRLGGKEIPTKTLLKKTGMLISSFGEDDAGELYLVDHRGSVYQIIQ